MRGNNDGGSVQFSCKQITANGTNAYYHKSMIVKVFKTT